MEGGKYERISSVGQLHQSVAQENNRNSDKNPLEAAYDLGLAGLRQYLEQLRPEQRSKLISVISENIEKY